MAAQQYERYYESGVRRRFVRRLLGASPSLVTPESDRNGGGSGTWTHMDTVHAVTIDRIRGSETHLLEFDDHFHPVRAHNRDTWITIAANFLRGVVLPTATLARIGGELYVRSGHEAISVARAFGQTTIDARTVHSRGGASRKNGHETKKIDQGRHRRYVETSRYGAGLKVP